MTKEKTNIIKIDENDTTAELLLNFWIHPKKDFNFNSAFLMKKIKYNISQFIFNEKTIENNFFSEINYAKKKMRKNERTHCKIEFVFYKKNMYCRFKNFKDKIEDIIIKSIEVYANDFNVEYIKK